MHFGDRRGDVMVMFNIELTDAEMEVIGQGLDELKYKVAKPVAEKIQRQIDAQLAVLANTMKQPPPEV